MKTIMQRSRQSMPVLIYILSVDGCDQMKQIETICIQA